MITGRIISILIGYVCGLFLSGYFVGKMKHVDVTKVGSGNVGATNTLRSLGWQAGALTLLGDICKVFAGMFICWLLFHRTQSAEVVRVFMMYAGFGAVLGHDFPVYMKFKGGKGISCTGGLVLAFCPFAAPISLGLFILVTIVTRYVSLGSIIALVSLFIQVLFWGKYGWFHLSEQYLTEVYIIFGLLALIGIVKHHANIKRLLNGTENKFGSKKSSAETR